MDQKTNDQKIEIQENSMQTQVDKYLSNPSKEEKATLITEFLGYFYQWGESNFRLNVWKQFSSKQQDQFVNDLFNQLIDANPAQKMEILDLIEVLFFDLSQESPEMQKKLLYILYAALLNKKNYKLALSALDIYQKIWKSAGEYEDLTNNVDTEILVESPKTADSKGHTTEEETFLTGQAIRDEIFPKILDFIDNRESILAEQGIFVLLNLLEIGSTSRQREQAFFDLIELFQHKIADSVQYEALDALNEIFTRYLFDLSSKSIPVLSKQVLTLVKSKQIKHPKPVFALFRLILNQKLSLSAESEAGIFKKFREVSKKLDYEYIIEFWGHYFQFLQNSGFTPKHDLINPFLDQILEQFRSRDSLDARLSTIITDLVNWIWELNILTENELNQFY